MTNYDEYMNRLASQVSDEEIIEADDSSDIDYGAKRKAKKDVKNLDIKKKLIAELDQHTGWQQALDVPNPEDLGVLVLRRLVEGLAKMSVDHMADLLDEAKAVRFNRKGVSHVDKILQGDMWAALATFDQEENGRASSTALDEEEDASAASPALDEEEDEAAASPALDEEDDESAASPALSREDSPAETGASPEIESSTWTTLKRRAPPESSHETKKARIVPSLMLSEVQASFDMELGETVDLLGEDEELRPHYKKSLPRLKANITRLVYQHFLEVSDAHIAGRP